MKDLTAKIKLNDIKFKKLLIENGLKYLTNQLLVFGNFPYHLVNSLYDCGEFGVIYNINTKIDYENNKMILSIKHCFGGKIKEYSKGFDLKELKSKYLKEKEVV